MAFLVKSCIELINKINAELAESKEDFYIRLTEDASFNSAALPAVIIAIHKNLTDIQKDARITNGAVQGRVYLTALMGCCGVVILSGLHVYNGSGGKGTKLINIAERFCKQANYGTIVATDIDKSFLNKPHVLAKTGFIEMGKFKNPKTENTVIFWKKDIY